ncbi:hypothetical protein [Paraburkholderia sp. CI3]|uniref:hypothetical protein n=1 Tax=Paraburkholderia sp. CI3 TaxID=2991060 RepID=UPI003D25E618
MTLKAQWYRDRLAKKSRKGFCGYPVATVAFYGPDDRRATKVALGVVAYEGADSDPVERWFCETSDARTDPEITEAVVRFIEQHDARSVVAVDRIIGCPRRRKASTIRKAKSVRSVRSGAAVTGGAASSSGESDGVLSLIRGAASVEAGVTMLRVQRCSTSRTGVPLALYADLPAVDLPREPCCRQRKVQDHYASPIPAARGRTLV